MDAKELATIIRLGASGLSIREIESQTGIGKSTIQVYLKRQQRLNLSLEQANAMTPQALLEKLSVDRSANLGYFAADYEAAYIRYHRKGKARTSLKNLWQEYMANVPEGLHALSYKAYCKGFAKFCQNLPATLAELSMTNLWNPADVAMIDYSGDGLCLQDPTSETHPRVKVQIFVAVLAHSGYIFCCATPRQTRDDWLDAQIKMFEFFQGVPQHIYLDNSTTLVKKADKHNPVICQEYIAFCDYYGTVPVAVRPNHPRDKALVENAVLQCQRSILTPLAHRTFFTLEDMNRAILIELTKLNDRALTTRNDGLSRSSFFANEKLLLQSLPVYPYEPSMINKTLKVQKDYLVRYKNKRYSVPSAYVGKRVQVLIWPRQNKLQVYDIKTGEQIATHHLMIEGSDTRILLEHMPPNHRAMLLTKQQLVTRLTQCGPKSTDMAQLVEQHNLGETGRKLLRHMDGLRQRLGNDLYEQLCSQTLARPNPRYELLIETVDNYTRQNKTTLTLRRGQKMTVPANTKNIRGAQYYKDFLTRNDQENNHGKE